MSVIYQVFKMHAQWEPLPWHKNAPNTLNLGLQQGGGEEKENKTKQQQISQPTPKNYTNLGKNPQQSVWGNWGSKIPLDVCSWKAK